MVEAQFSASAPGVGMAAPSRARTPARLEELRRRIESVCRLQSSEARDLLPIQHADFARTLAAARTAAEAGDDRAIATAMRALDLLSLELCEE